MNTPKQDCEHLMQDILPLAKRMLADHGEFYPYGGMLRADREIVHVGAQEKGTDMPASRTLIDILQRHFREEAASNTIIASCLVFDVRIRRPGTSDKVDAIQVNLDHITDYSVEVIFPYGLEHGRLIVDEPFAQAGDGLIFGRTSNSDSV